MQQQMAKAMNNHQYTAESFQGNSNYQRQPGDDTPVQAGSMAQPYDSHTTSIN
jgi:hypothetical protein